MDIQNIARVQPFTTKDGSEIRELLAHRNSSIRNQSLAEARLPVGGQTTPHFHPQTEDSPSPVSPNRNDPLIRPEAPLF